ncbi:MAG: Cys-tRNA(Pro) deacylase [Glaciecola sp.]
MTPAIEYAKKHNINYIVHEYKHDPNTSSYGLEASEKLAVLPKCVFKTLVLGEVDSQKLQQSLAVAVVPVQYEVNLKRFAKAMGWKKAALAPKDKVMRSSGYVIGGVSPIGQKRELPTIIDDSAKPLDSMFVSAGKRGLEIELGPQDLGLLTHATYAEIRQ